MASGYGYDTYYTWEFIFPIFFCCLMMFLNIIVTFVGYCVFFLKCGGDENNNYTNCLINSCFFYSKIVFRDIISKKDKDETEEKIQTIKFQKYEIDARHILPFSTVTTVVLACVFISFWASFLIEETFVCDPLLDCFMTNSSTLDPDTAHRVNDCALVPKDIDVECNNFVLDTSEGFASAIGFLAVAVIYVNVYAYGFILLREWIHTNPGISLWKKCCSSFVLFLYVFFPIIISLFSVIFIYSIDFFSDIAFKTNESSLKFFAYLICFEYVGPLVGVYLLYITRKPQQLERKDYNSLQNVE